MSFTVRVWSIPETWVTDHYRPGKVAMPCGGKTDNPQIESDRSAVQRRTGRAPTIGFDLVLLALGFGLLFAVVPHGIYGDATVRFGALHDLIERGTISPMAYSFVEPLFAVPFYLVGKIWLGPEWWCARFNTALLAIGFLVARALLRTPDERRSLNLCWLTLVAASMFPNHLRDFNSEPLTAVFVAVGLIAVCAGYALAGWTAVVLGVVNTPAAMLGLAFVAGVHAWNTKRWRHLAAVPAAVALLLLESWIRRGSPLATGYENNAGFRTIMPYSSLPGFSYPLFFGLMSILFSFGKGLLFFSPGLFIRLRTNALVSERLHASWRLWLWFLGGLILVYAKWWAWYGGFAWGPRLLLFASIPASLALAARLRDPDGRTPLAIGGAIVALALSVWVAVNGVLFAQQDLSICSQNFYALEFTCWYVPEFSVLWKPFVAGESVRGWPGLFAVYCLVVALYLAAPSLAEWPRVVRCARR
jgi:hypothetical protein